MNETAVFITGEAENGMRVDAFLADQLEDVSRSLVQKAIRRADVSINGKTTKRSSQQVHAGDEVAIVLPDQPTIELEPEPIPLDILFEDKEVLVINKPPGLVVHPAPGHYTGTMLNAILYHCPDFMRPGEDPIRPGIVHRLDRDTSGVLVVAKTQRAMDHLARQAREHTFERRYVALVRGEFSESRGRITAAVGRSLSDRKRMTVTAVGGRDAVTRFEVLDRFEVASQLRLELETGRTHQIRVHMRFAGHQILGDPVYGVTDYSHWNVPEFVITALQQLRGQALHAERLGFEHPGTGERLAFSSPPHPDYAEALTALLRWRDGR